MNIPYIIVVEENYANNNGNFCRGTSLVVISELIHHSQSVMLRFVRGIDYISLFRRIIARSPNRGNEEELFIAFEDFWSLTPSTVHLWYFFQLLHMPFSSSYGNTRISRFGMTHLSLAAEIATNWNHQMHRWIFIVAGHIESPGFHILFHRIWCIICIKLRLISS